MNGQQLYEKMQLMSEEEREQLFIPNWWWIDDVEMVITMLRELGHLTKEQDEVIKNFDDDDLRDILHEAIREVGDNDPTSECIKTAIMDAIIVKADYRDNECITKED